MTMKGGQNHPQDKSMNQSTTCIWHYLLRLTNALLYSHVAPFFSKRNSVQSEALSSVARGCIHTSREKFEMVNTQED